jgi:hypothetical protein
MNAVENMSTMVAETRVDWVDFMQETKQAKSPSSAIQDAMGILEGEDRSKLSVEEYLEAVSVMENYTKALIFCAIAPGDIRDRWLSREIAKVSKQ